MELYRGYQRIIDGLAFEPQNEAQTKEWVLVPILEQVLGYATGERLPEDKGQGGTRHDYTILPNTDHTWVLEAKQWNTPLTDQHALQVTTYAYQSPDVRRWAVLTNGKEWRLYDSSVTQGGIADKLALVARRDEPLAMEAVLEAIRRETVVQDGVARAVRTRRLTLFLTEQLTRPDSRIIRSLLGPISKQPWLEGTTAQEIVTAFGDLTAFGDRVPSEPPEAPSIVPQPSPSADPAPVTQPPSSARSDLVPITSVGSVTGHRLVRAVGPDGVDLGVHSWRDLWIGVVKVVLRRGRVSIPWRPRSGYRICLDWEKGHAGGRTMRTPEEMEYGGRTLFLETHGSADDLMSLAVRLCEAAGVDPAGFRIEIVQSDRPATS